MQRGATDGAFLRQKGMAVYGVPVFRREDRENRSHGNDERIAIDSMRLAMQILFHTVREVCE
jgi:acetylornithine deacetylase/succinyl-diaminopimelate desuccinylase-like protein